MAMNKYLTRTRQSDAAPSGETRSVERVLLMFIELVTEE